MTTMAATAAADESSGVDRKDGKDVHFGKSSLRIAVQRRRESADVNRWEKRTNYLFSVISFRNNSA